MPLPATAGRTGSAMPGIGWLRVAVVVGCATHATAASANCAIVALGGAASLITCTEGVRGTMIDLGGGLTSYRLSNGASGVVYLRTASTSANAAPATASIGTSASPTSPGLAVPTGSSIFYLVNGTINAAAATATDGKPGALAPLQTPLSAPLTPAMPNIANSGLARQMPARAAIDTAATASHVEPLGQAAQ